MTYRKVLRKLVPLLSGSLLLAPTFAGCAAPTGVDAVLGNHMYRFPYGTLQNIEPPAPNAPLELNLPVRGELQPSSTAPKRDAIVETMLAHIPMTVSFSDRPSVVELLHRKVVNDDSSVVGSLERRDPRERLELRVKGRAWNGLVPYTVDEDLMTQFARDYQTRYGRALTRQKSFEPDWLIGLSPDGGIATVISCDPADSMQAPASLSARPMNVSPGAWAGCIHYFIDPTRQLFYQMTYNRQLLGNWKQMEDAAKETMARAQMR